MVSPTPTRSRTAIPVTPFSIFATVLAKYLGNWVGPFVDQVVGTAFGGFIDGSRSSLWLSTSLVGFHQPA